MQGAVGFETDDFHGHSLAWFGALLATYVGSARAQRPAIANAGAPTAAGITPRERENARAASRARQARLAGPRH
jgi:hypothetical protein